MATHIATIVLILLLIPIILSDVRRHRVPNIFSLGGTCVLVLLQSGLALYANSYPIIISSLLGLLIASAIGFALWHLGFIGGGDHKTLILVGTAVGYPAVLPTLLLIGIAGGVQSVIWLLLYTKTERSMRPSRNNMHSTLRTPMPYTLAIAVGTIAQLLLGLQL